VFVRRSLLPVLLLFVTLVTPAQAWTSKGTPEASALLSVRIQIQVFESEKKRLPESWKELDDFSGKSFDQLYPEALPTIRYELFSPPPSLRLGGRSVQVIAMTRKPMWETTRTGTMGRTLALKGPGRYIVRRTENGNFTSEWFTETAIQRLWPSTGRALPVPDDEPERPWVKSARWLIIMKRVGLGAVMVLSVIWIVRRLRGERKATTEPLAN